MTDAMQYPRTHERLRSDITADPIFLFQRKRVSYADCGLEWDVGCECLVEDGKEITEDDAVERGLAIAYWDTETVFLTREDGVAYGEARAYNYPKGWRVYCVMARGDLVHVLAEATEGGRYR